MLFAVLAGCDPCIVEDKSKREQYKRPRLVQDNKRRIDRWSATLRANPHFGFHREACLHPGDDDGCRPRITKSKAQNQGAIVPSSAF